MGKKASRGRLHQSSYLLGGVIFTIIMCLIVVGRTLSIFTTAGHWRCQDMLMMQYGQTVYDVGAFDTFFWTICAVALFYLTAIIVGLVARNYTKMDIILGVVNGLMIAGLFAFCAIPWAFNNPTAPLAKDINGLTLTLGVTQYYSEPDLLFDEPLYPQSSNWTEIEPDVWRSERLELIVKYTVVETCFADAFIQENKAARIADYDGGIPNYNSTKGYVFYTLQGAYLSSGEPRWLGAHAQFVPYRFLSQEKRGTKETIEILSRAVDQDLKLSIAEYGTKNLKQSLYTREEIEALVERDWRGIDSSRERRR